MVYSLISNPSRGCFALLVDPDKNSKNLPSLVEQAQKYGVDFIMVGGSIVKQSLEDTIKTIRDYCNLPITLFPGSAFQFTPKADAILLLSLISGRNAEFLIGNHVIVSQALRDSGMEIIPTGYMLVNSGEVGSVQYMSNTMPIPGNKPEIAIATALAGQQLGLKAIYLEGGSGTVTSVSETMVKSVCSNVDVPVIVGGGIRNPNQVKAFRKAGASVIVVGNTLEENPSLFKDMVDASR
jgi:phosphoglycerol geranylgeranyltransferase